MPMANVTGGRTLTDAACSNRSMRWKLLLYVEHFVDGELNEMIRKEFDTCVCMCSRLAFVKRMD